MEFKYEPGAYNQTARLYAESMAKDVTAAAVAGAQLSDQQLKGLAKEYKDYKDKLQGADSSELRERSPKAVWPRARQFEEVLSLLVRDDKRARALLDRIRQLDASK